MASRPPELLMPVSDEHALRQFEIEALQRINDNLRLLNNGQAKMVESMHSIDIRLTRIESASVSLDVSELKREVEELKEDKFQRDGARKLASGAMRNGPALISILTGLIVVIVVLIANGKI